MLLRERLEKFEFSPAEGVVVEYLLEHSDKIDEMSIGELAAETYTQPSTLVRIAKKMNFKGWKDFKKAYLEEYTYFRKSFLGVDANLPFQRDDSIMTIAGKIATLEKSTIDDLYSLLRYENLMEAKEILLKSNCIRVFAQNANLLIASDFALKMNRIRKNVIMSSVKGEEGYEAYNLQKEDCAIIISYSGENRTLLRINEILRNRKIPIIGITSIGDNQLSQKCTCVLPVTTREKLYSKVGNFTTNISVIFLLDVLYSIVFEENFDRNFDHLKKVGESVDKREITSAVMKEK